MQLGKDPKVALCLSGQLRNFEEGSSNIKSHICNQYDTTVFVSCWDTRGFKLTGFEYMRRLLPPHLADKFPEKYVGPKFANYFPKSVALLKDLAMSPVTKADVTKVYKDAIIQVIKEADFERTYLTESLRKAYVNREYILSQFKMYRQIHLCNELRKQYEKEKSGTFDVVIRLRPDYQFGTERLSIPDEFGHDVFVDVLHPNEGVGDQFAMSSGRNMDVYSSVWELALLATDFEGDLTFRVQRRAASYFSSRRSLVQWFGTKNCTAFKQDFDFAEQTTPERVWKSASFRT